MELPLPVYLILKYARLYVFSPHSVICAAPSVSGFRGIGFSHISHSPHVYGWKKIFERPGGEISGQLVPHKIGQILLPHWYRKIGAAIR